MEDSDDGDDYFERMQSYVDGIPENDDDQINQHSYDESSAVIFETDKEYYDAVEAANVDNSLVVSEESVVWQYVMRETATLPMSKRSINRNTLQSIDNNDFSAVTLLKQWLYNILPVSSNVYCLLHKLTTTKHFAIEEVVSLESSFFVDNILQPNMLLILVRSASSNIISVHIHVDAMDEESLDVFIVSMMNTIDDYLNATGSSSSATSKYCVEFKYISSSLFERMTCLGAFNQWLNSHEWSIISNIETSQLHVLETDLHHGGETAMDSTGTGYYIHDRSHEEFSSHQEGAENTSGVVAIASGIGIYPVPCQGSHMMPLGDGVDSQVNCIEANADDKPLRGRALWWWSVSYYGAIVSMRLSSAELALPSEIIAGALQQLLRNHWDAFGFGCAPFIYLRIDNGDMLQSILLNLGFRKIQEYYSFRIGKS